MTSRNFILLAALFGFLGVGFGAFGAHGLSAYFAAHPDLQDDFRTATQYHLYHALALIGAAWVAERYPGRWSRWAGLVHRRDRPVFGQPVRAGADQSADYGRGRAARRAGVTGRLGVSGVCGVAGIEKGPTVNQPPMPTPYREVNRLLVTLLERVETILREKLVGFYLYGSLSAGDFDPEFERCRFPDRDRRGTQRRMLDELREMHTSIAASGLPYACRLEGSYIPQGALRRYDPANAMHPTIGIDWEFGVGQHGTNWILERWIVREKGIIVWGPSPETLIDPVAPDELRMAVCGMLRDFWQAQLDGPDWLRPRDYQAFAILSMCRALYTIGEGKVASKPEAAVWALQRLDPKWEALIEQSLVWRHEHDADDMTDMLLFLRFAVARGLELCG